MTSNLTEETIISLSGKIGEEVGEEISKSILTLEASADEKLVSKIPKSGIRASLHASTWDGIFATLFSNVTGGVLLSNFFVELEATSLQIGLLASIPMVANLLQPFGAYWADRTTSRRLYSRWVYGISRLLWLPLAIAIIVFSWHPAHPQQMIFATLAILFATHALGAIGSASWLTWLATLVPRQLRGRYFGFRNSTFSLTSLITLPFLGVFVSHWQGGTIQGFGVLVVLGVVAGLISLGFQSRMVDVNPIAHTFTTNEKSTLSPILSASIASDEDAEPSNRTIPSIVETAPEAAQTSIFSDSHFLLFLFYFGLWAFGVNLSNPFFNVYLLNNLALNLSWVTLYNGLGAGANLLMLLLWGKLADQIGNRPILLLDGILVAVTPLLWLGTDATSVSIWLWFPLLHILGGGTGAAIDLCMNNLQLAIAPVQHHTKYFAITAAIGGVSGALGALAGGWFAHLATSGSMTELFTISGVLRFVALLPLIWVQEPQGRSIKRIMQQTNQQLQSWFWRSKVQVPAE